MNKLLISAGAVAALALSSAPALAATPTTQATATARIVEPLTITSARDMDFGTIVLSGTGPYTDTITMTRAGAVTCGGNTTCSGTTKSARYTMTGTRDQKVTITVSPTIALVNQTQTSPDLTLTVDSPALATLDSTGVGAFNIGGSIDVSDTTVDGIYTGTFDVSADYQ